MSYLTFRMRRLIWMVCACVCVLAARSATAEPRVTVDRNSDGQCGDVTRDLREPSVLDVSFSTHVRHSRAPLVQIPAGELDDGHRPEPVARELPIHVWTRKHDTFRRYRARTSCRCADRCAARPPPAHIPV